jgi:hypothetical protein
MGLKRRGTARLQESGYGAAHAASGRHKSKGTEGCDVNVQLGRSMALGFWNVTAQASLNTVINRHC